MTTISATTGGTAAAAPRKSGLGSLDQGDFMKMMLAQMKQQDPFDPVDQKDMLAQMAQFTSLAGTTEMGETLKAIAAKLDAVLAAQTAAAQTAAAQTAAAETTTPA